MHRFDSFRVSWATRRCLVAFAIVLALACSAGTARSGPPSTQPLAAGKPTGQTDTCASDTCHAGLMGKKHMHGPTAQQKCLACHEYDEPREHRFKLASNEEQLCGDCHSMQHRTVVHAPLKQGRCTGCHDPHGSDFPTMLVADPVRGLCLSCHKQDFAQKEFIHGPVATGACILCHEPHSSWEPKLLVQSSNKLCLDCHAELVPKGSEERHVHAPVKDGGCTSCHDPHASTVKFQLKEAPREMCLSCHKETERALASSTVVHGAMEQSDGCTTCHSPHFSQLPKLQRVAQPQSCLECHKEPLKSADAKPLTDIATVLKENPQQHGPIREGACTACHQPHGGDKFRLLTAEYPAAFYAPFKIENYALCFSCHIPDLVLKQQGTGLTRFRDGDMNLHWLHVNKEKGRTCRACHEVHASKHPFHIREAVPFGAKDWMLEIGYEQTARGGSCSPGCHGPKSYDHGGTAPLAPPRTEPAASPQPLKTTMTPEGNHANGAK